MCTEQCSCRRAHKGSACTGSNALCCGAQQFIQAVAYCHTHNVAHRDLKLDNTLLDGAVPARIKLCDFGFAKRWSSDDSVNMMTMIGCAAVRPIQTTAADAACVPELEVCACTVALLTLCVNRALPILEQILCLTAELGRQVLGKASTQRHTSPY